MTCNIGNAFDSSKMTEIYACGVQIDYGTRMSTGDHNELPSLPPLPGPGIEKCCAIRNKRVQRIPGNTGCDIQWCEAPAADFNRTTTINSWNYGYSTYLASATVAPGDPIVTAVPFYGPLPQMEDCIFNLTGRDLGLTDEQLNDEGWSVSTFCQLQTFDPCEDPGPGPDCSTGSKPSSTITSMPTGLGLSTSTATDVASSTSATASATANAARRTYSEVPANGLMKWLTAGLLAFTTVCAWQL